jgi:hypothetical protein
MTQTKKWFPSLTLITLLMGLSGCDILSRFFEETYLCETPDAIAHRISFNEEFVGGKLHIESKEGDLTVVIDSLTDDELAANTPWGRLIIDRQTGKVGFIKAATYTSTNCRKALLQM